MKPASSGKIETSASYSSQALSLFQVEGMPASQPPVVELMAEGDDCKYPARPERTLDTQCGDC